MNSNNNTPSSDTAESFLSPEESEAVNVLLADIIQFKPYCVHSDRLLLWNVCKQTRRTTRHEANIVYLVAGRIKFDTTN